MIGQLHIEPVTVQPRPLDERFHTLIGKEIAGTIDDDETDELNLMCAMKAESIGEME